MSQDHCMTVTDLTRYIKSIIDTDRVLQDVWVRGELSNFKLHSSGHMYFTLKDSDSRISGVMFRSINRHLRFRPEDGMKVLLRGEVSVYEARGQYQIYAKEMQPDGIGSLYLAYEKLKESLAKEGLFSKEHKKSLPVFPTEIGVVTSPTGAAVRDIITTIKRRFPIARITVFPCQVQGQSAAPTIIRAIELANELGTSNVLIVGRGGGSIEELWAFNEESVARSIFASKIPVISAVGHETDFTIADFVADMRAPTPSGAGELAVPSLAELRDRLSDRHQRPLKAVIDRMEREKERLNNLVKSYGLRYPANTLRQKAQELGEKKEQLDKRINWTFQYKLDKWLQVYHSLQINHPQDMLNEAVNRYALALKVLHQETDRRLDRDKVAFGNLVARLNGLSPLRILERGYSVTYKDKELISSVKQVQQGDNITVQLGDGKLGCQVFELKEGELFGNRGNEG